MKQIVLTLVVAISSMFGLPYALHGQQAEAPTYKDGDWWRVKLERKRD